MKDPFPYDPLTDRQWAIAELVAEGLDNPTIAKRVFLSRATVASHVSQALKRLGYTSRVQIAVWVTERRLRTG